MQIYITNNNESYVPPSEDSFKMESIHDKAEKKQLHSTKIPKPNLAQDAVTNQDKANST